MVKKIGRSDIIGDRGIAFIKQVVLEIGFVFYETGGVEAGIDGYIEIRDTKTGVVSNQVLQFQSRATTRALPGHTEETFAWTITVDSGMKCNAVMKSQRDGFSKLFEKGLEG